MPGWDTYSKKICYLFNNWLSQELWAIKFHLIISMYQRQCCLNYHLKIAPYQSTGTATLSSEYLQNLWFKAASILSKEGNIVPAPGTSSEYMVLSLTSDKVGLYPAGKLVCDCMGYKSAKMCSYYSCLWLLQCYVWLHCLVQTVEM